MRRKIKCFMPILVVGIEHFLCGILQRDYREWNKLGKDRMLFAEICSKYKKLIKRTYVLSRALKL